MIVSPNVGYEYPYEVINGEHMGAHRLIEDQRGARFPIFLFLVVWRVSLPGVWLSVWCVRGGFSGLPTALGAERLWSECRKPRCYPL
jgi:hypothetical protein